MRRGSRVGPVLLITSLLLMATVLLMVPGAFAQGEGIVDSPHDFTVYSWGPSEPGDSLCAVCHVPHHGVEAASGLLWNHQLSTAAYTMYDSSWSDSLDGTQSPQPAGTSRLCLGCHDGTVALENWDGVTDGTTFVRNRLQIGPDLTSTHPVSITYDEVGDGGLNPTSTTFATGSTIGDILEFGRVECKACHDVHNVEVIGRRLTRDSGHDLCLTCHNK